MFSRIDHSVGARGSVALTFLFLGAGASCGNDGGAAGGASASVGGGRVAVTITAEPASGIESFSVDLRRVALRSTSGVIVELLDATARIDLASSTEFSRLLSNSRIPAGTYTGAVMGFDFGTAVGLVSGAVSPAQIKDLDGHAFSGSVEWPVSFAAPIVVTSVRHPRLEIGFDLGASLVVDRAANAIVLEPAVVLAIDPPRTRALVAAGTFTSADVALGAVSVRLRGKSGAVLDSLTLCGTAFTLWRVNGVPVMGAAGVVALGALPANAPVRAVGSLDSETGVFEVTSVESGDGVRGGTTSSVEGTVVGRAGGSGSNALLEVLGRSTGADGVVLSTGASFIVRTNSISTEVARVDDSQARGVDDIALGQHVRAHGLLAGTSLDASGLRGVVVLERTQLFGTVVGVPSTTRIFLAVERVDGKPADAITWSDAGSFAVDPAHLEVELGALVVAPALGARVEVNGHFRPVETIGIDFDAESVLGVASSPSLVFVRNRPQFGLSVAATVSSGRIEIVASGTAVPGERAVLDLGSAGSVPLLFTPPVAWVDAADRGVFTLRDRSAGRLQTFASYSSFTTELERVLAQGAVLIQLGARGRYSRPLNTVDAGVGSAVID